MTSSQSTPQRRECTGEGFFGGAFSTKSLPSIIIITNGLGCSHRVCRQTSIPATLWAYPSPNRPAHCELNVQTAGLDVIHAGCELNLRRCLSISTRNQR